MQVIPDVGAPAGRPESGDSQCGSVLSCQRGEVVELVNVVAGHHYRDLRILEARCGEILQRPQGHVIGTTAAHGVVHVGGGAVQRDLHVNIVAGGEPLGDIRCDAHTIGGKLDADVVSCRIVDELPKVRPHSGFPTADIDVENLHTFELVDNVHALACGQFAGIATARR